MKQKRKIFILAAVFLLLISGVLSACSNSSLSSDTTAETTQETTTVSEEEDMYLLGKVTYAGEYYISVDVLVSDETVIDYTTLDTSTLYDGDSVDYIYPDTDVEYYLIEDGLYVTAEQSDIAEGDIIAENYTADGTQQIIIIEKATAETQETTQEETSSEN